MQGDQDVRQFPRMRQVLRCGGLRLRSHLAEIGACTEYISGARQLQHRHLRVTGVMLARRAERADGRAIKRVSFVRTIERSVRDAAGNRDRDRRAAGHMSSTAIAVASPPPMHRLAMPRFLPRAFSAWINVVRMRAPVAPIGCPRAHAPPLTFTLACSNDRSFIAAIGTAAKASLIS